jgi:polar amino acid transport system substrate-binding protein
MNHNIHRQSICAALLATFLLLFVSLLRAEEVITLHFTDRAPFTELTPDGSVVGLVADEGVHAFTIAELPFVWQVSSMKRILHTLQQPTGQNCAIGFFKTPEREQYAKYTKPIFRDGPTVLIARKEIALQSAGKLEDILAIPNLRVLVKGSYSYGPTVDALLIKVKPKLIVADTEVRQMVEMLKADRSDILISTEEEANYLINEADRGRRTLNILSLTGMPAGEYRYILCSKAVADDVIERLNRAIRFK